MLRKKDGKRLESFEMWCWRKMMKVKWSEHSRNVDILNEVGETTC